MPDNPLLANETHFETALIIFRLDMQSRRLSARTLEHYDYALLPFCDWLTEQGVTTVQGIQSVHIRAYLAGMQERGLSAATQHTIARGIRAWLNFHVREGDIAESPMNRVGMPRLENKLPVTFSQDDVNAIIKACYTRRDLAMVLCLLDTGCRAAEFVALNVGDVDIATGAVKVHRGKGAKDRTVFIGARTRRALLRYLAQRRNPPAHYPLWATYANGTRLKRAGLRMFFRRLAERADVEHCHPHTFRRTFALWSLRAGMNIYALQALMGHADLTVLRRYLALVESDLQTAHREHGPVDAHLTGRK